MASVKVVLFNVGNETYGINIDNIQGIEKYVNILPVPNAPRYIEGIINLRGDVIPIYSLRAKFSLHKVSVTDETKLIIAQSNSLLVGFEVDFVKEIVEIPEEEITQPPIIIKSNNTKYVGSVAHINNGLTILLDLDGVLNESEQENIQALLKE